MINNEKVTIELKSNNKNFNNPPIKFCRSRNGKPSNKNFVFRATAFPQLTDCVKNISWSSVAKTLTVQLLETSKCEVYQWISYINDITNTLQNKPYSDLDANSVVVTFQDNEEVDIADLRLKNISIIYHECTLDKSDNCENACLQHLVTFSYQFEEFLLRQSLENKDDTDLQEADDEWQTIETP